NNSSLQGHTEAMWYLARSLEEGRGVTKDEKAAVMWYTRAAEKGLAKAQNNLAVSYSLGRGVAKDKLTAQDWYEKAADQGFAPAQYNLGRYLLDEVGMEVEACVLFGAAAMKKLPEAVAASDRCNERYIKRYRNK